MKSNTQDSQACLRGVRPGRWGAESDVQDASNPGRLALRRRKAPAPSARVSRDLGPVQRAILASIGEAGGLSLLDMRTIRLQVAEAHSHKSSFPVTFSRAVKALVRRGYLAPVARPGRRRARYFIVAPSAAGSTANGLAAFGGRASAGSRPLGA